MPFDAAYPLDRVQPAPYNPRSIDEAARQALKESIGTLGMLKPIIVCEDGRLIAGHQRTTALRALGCSTTPAFVLPQLSYEDEVRFNQFHNASDLDLGDATVALPPSTKRSWVVVPAASIDCDPKPRNAGKKAEILRLLAKYGPWGAVIAAQSGEVLVSALYAVCCSILGLPCMVRYVPESQHAAVLQRFGQSYGVFSYDHIERSTWTQNRTQMKHLRAGSRVGKSTTYERFVLPRLTKAMRMLDFGAGQLDYATRLQREGYDVTALEFYLCQAGSQKVDVSRVHGMIDALCADLSTRGRYDFVVCDSVLNSVDRAHAEADILTCLAALCRPGGTVVFSGRSREFVDYVERETTVQAGTRERAYTHFLDAEGISAQYAQGVWRYQKYHTFAQVAALCQAHFGTEYQIFTNEARGSTEATARLRGSSWCVVARNGVRHAPAALHQAVTREFDLPLPGGKSYNRAADMLQALASAGLDVSP